MAHWAKIDENNKVVNIIKINDADYDDEGYAWIEKNLGGKWIKTSINTRGGVHYGADDKPDGGTALRKNYAVLGGIYDEARDAFISPKPEPILLNNVVFQDFVFNEDTCSWDVVQSY
jgi:hypothetical protein